MKCCRLRFWSGLYLRTLLFVTTLTLLVTVQGVWEAFVFTCHAENLPFHLLPSHLRDLLPSDCLQRPLLPWVFLVPFVLFYVAGMCSGWWSRRRFQQAIALISAMFGTLLTAFLFSVSLLRAGTRDQLAQFGDDVRYLLALAFVVLVFAFSVVAEVRTRVSRA